MTRVLYFITGFERGGAELGLLHLIRSGVFRDCDLQVASIVGGARDFIAEFEGAGVAPTVFFDRPRMRLADIAAAAAKLDKLIVALRPDVLILSLPQANIIGRVVGGLRRVPRIIAFEHNARLAKPGYAFAYWLTSPFVSAVWADCDETLRVALKRHYMRRPKHSAIAPLLTLTPHPLHPLTERRKRDPSAAFEFVSVGRMTRVKNHELAIRALALVRARGVIAKLTILGDGVLRAHLEQVVRELNLGDAVSLPGFRKDWAGKADFDGLVLTSRYEGLCMVALEAMRARIPVIAPWIGGLRDYGDETSFLALPDWRTESVADAMCKLAQDPKLVASLATRAQERAMAYFGEEACRRAFMALNADLRGAGLAGLRGAPDAGLMGLN